MAANLPPTAEKADGTDPARIDMRTAGKDLSDLRWISWILQPRDGIRSCVTCEMRW